MKHTYTEEQKEKIAQMLFDFLRKHNCFGGEHFMQDDDCQIDSIDFMSDLADIKDVTDRDPVIIEDNNPCINYRNQESGWTCRIYAVRCDGISCKEHCDWYNKSSLYISK